MQVSAEQPLHYEKIPNRWIFHLKKDKKFLQIVKVEEKYFSPFKKLLQGLINKKMILEFLTINEVFTYYFRLEILRNLLFSVKR
jgi:hypothetical protein